MSQKVIELENELGATSDKVERLAILLELLDHLTVSDYVEGWRYGHQALELAEQLGDRVSVAAAHEDLANCLWKLAEYSESIDHYENALDNFLSLGDLYGAARCYSGLGIVAGSLENYRASLEYFDDGLSAAKRAGKQELAATITGNIGHVYFKLGNYADAMSCFENSLEFYQHTRDFVGAGNMLGGMAGIHVYQGEHSKGLEIVRRALQLHKQANNVRGIAVSMMNIGIALQKMGKLEQSRKELKSALNYSRSISLKTTEHDILKNLSEVCSELEDHAEANKYLELYLEVQHEEKQLAVKRKNEQFRQRQQIREMQERSA
ncbi:MAG: tetratricopeptide repeat protein [Flavobacteriales bacterium]|nr:tetratricopeptide repeat protein [Flavobacteriales bacterium]